MSEQPSTVLWRYIHRGRLRWAMPTWLIEESAGQVVSAIVPGVVTMGPKNMVHERYVQDLLTGWELDPWVWHTRRILQIAPYDAAHTLGLHWDHATGAFLGWYVNLQEPLRRSRLGFDSFDQMLDVWIEPDGTWGWKDWDELVEAERVGLFTSAEAAAIRAEGERVIASLGTRLPTGWEEWQPDPSWALPTMPEGWDRL
jgi:hypothetical protein